MGYKMVLDALLYLLVSFHFNKRALEELKATGDFTGLGPQECVTARHDIEALVSLDEFYAIEEETVEDKNGAGASGRNCTGACADASGSCVAATGASDGENLDLGSASAIRDDIVADDQPARTRAEARRT
jgi:hypothetical protein